MATTKKSEAVALGTKTIWGTIVMVGKVEGDRYYWMVGKDKCLSMIPAFMVENQTNAGVTGAEFAKRPR